MSSDEDAAAKRRRVTRLQRWVLNPPMKALAWLGLAPGLVIVETRGRRSGRRRRTVVGAHHEDGTLWIVAEQGRHAGWVRNVAADPRVRVRRHACWRPGQAHVDPDDDASARLASWGRPAHARTVRSVGTDLTTVRIDLEAA